MRGGWVGGWGGGAFFDFVDIVLMRVEEEMCGCCCCFLVSLGRKRKCEAREIVHLIFFSMALHVCFVLILLFLFLLRQIDLTSSCSRTLLPLLYVGLVVLRCFYVKFLIATKKKDS